MPSNTLAAFLKNCHILKFDKGLFFLLKNKNILLVHTQELDFYNDHTMGLLIIIFKNFKEIIKIL